MADKLIYITDEEFKQFCEEHPTIKEKIKNTNIEMKLIKKELPKEKKVKIDVIKAYREELNNPIPPVSEQLEKNVAIFQKFCEEKGINDTIENADTDSAALQLIKDKFPEEVFSLITVTDYRILLKDNSAKAFQNFYEENQLDDKIKKIDDDNEAWELIKIQAEEKKYTIKHLIAYRTKKSIKTETKFIGLDDLQKFCKTKVVGDKPFGQIIKDASSDDEAFALITEQLSTGTSVLIETVKQYRELLKEASYDNALSQKDIDGAIVTKTELNTIDTLSLLNNKLVKENTTLKNQNDSLTQRIEVLKGQMGIKDDDFTSKFQSINEIASSDTKISISINKEVLVKATKYVDAHSLIRLENIITNGYDLNSIIVQRILLEFIYQNSLL